MRKSIIIFVFCLFNEHIFTQTNDKSINQNLNLLSRYRLSIGYVELLENNYSSDFRHPFFNVSFRSSGFDKSSSDAGVKFAFEPGINGLILSRKILSDGTDFNLYFVPYAKVGPEMRLEMNIFLAVSAGIIFVTYERFFAPLPFFGVNGFFLIPLNEKLNIEIESGFHTTFSQESLPLLFYLTAGVSFN